jgi:hypothetical protein
VVPTVDFEKSCFLTSLGENRVSGPGGSGGGRGAGFPGGAKFGKSGGAGGGPETPI